MCRHSLAVWCVVWAEPLPHKQATELTAHKTSIHQKPHSTNIKPACLLVHAHTLSTNVAAGANPVTTPKHPAAVLKLCAYYCTTLAASQRCRAAATHNTQLHTKHKHTSLKTCCSINRPSASFTTPPRSSWCWSRGGAAPCEQPRA